jgi:hypothetical protein
MCKNCELKDDRIKALEQIVEEFMRFFHKIDKEIKDEKPEKLLSNLTIIEPENVARV